MRPVEAESTTLPVCTVHCAVLLQQEIIDPVTYSNFKNNYFFFFSVWMVFACEMILIRK